MTVQENFNQKWHRSHFSLQTRMQTQSQINTIRSGSAVDGFFIDDSGLKKASFQNTYLLAHEKTHNIET